MAETTLLIPKLAIIDSLVLDCSISEQHQGDVEVTEHPVEFGANIVDHARPKPEQVTLEGLISNTPITLGQARRIVSTAGVAVESSVLEDALAGQPGYAEAAYATLRDLRENPRLVTIKTALRDYEDMVMTSLSVPRDAKTGEALRFTATFRHVRLVKNKSTTVTVRKERRPKVEYGKQILKTVGDLSKKEPDASSALKFLKALGVIN
jgi:hypothetical protein